MQFALSLPSPYILVPQVVRTSFPQAPSPCSCLSAASATAMQASAPGALFRFYLPNLPPQCSSKNIWKLSDTPLSLKQQQYARSCCQSVDVLCRMLRLSDTDGALSPEDFSPNQTRSLYVLVCTPSPNTTSIHRYSNIQSRSKNTRFLRSILLSVSNFYLVLVRK